MGNEPSSGTDAERSACNTCSSGRLDPDLPPYQRAPYVPKSNTRTAGGQRQPNGQHAANGASKTGADGHRPQGTRRPNRVKKVRNGPFGPEEEEEEEEEIEEPEPMPVPQPQSRHEGNGTTPDPRKAGANRHVSNRAGNGNGDSGLNGEMQHGLMPPEHETGHDHYDPEMGQPPSSASHKFPPLSTPQPEHLQQLNFQHQQQQHQQLHPEQGHENGNPDGQQSTDGGEATGQGLGLQENGHHPPTDSGRVLEIPMDVHRPDVRSQLIPEAELLAAQEQANLTPIDNKPKPKKKEKKVDPDEEVLDEATRARLVRASRNFSFFIVLPIGIILGGISLVVGAYYADHPEVYCSDQARLPWWLLAGGIVLFLIAGASVFMWKLGQERWVSPRRVYEQVGGCGAMLLLPWAAVGQFWVFQAIQGVCDTSLTNFSIGIVITMDIILGLSMVWVIGGWIWRNTCKVWCGKKRHFVPRMSVVSPPAQVYP